MRKSYRAGIIGITMAAASVMAAGTAFAGTWSQNAQGWWYATDAAGTNWFSNGWQWIDGNADGIAECYYFDANGYILANTSTPDGYVVDVNGAWVQDGNVQTRSSAGLDAANIGSASVPASAQSGSNVIIAADNNIYSSGSSSSGSSGSSGSGSSGAGSSSSSGSGSSGSSSSGTISSGSASSGSSSKQEEKDYSEYAQKCFELINKKRTANGLKELEWDESIAEACNIRAEEITEKFSHVRPNGDICFTAFDEVGLECEAEGENIAEGQSTPKSVVNAWMNSKGHRENILKKGYTRSAIGFVYDPDSDYKYYWVQMFGRNRGEEL